MRIGACLFLLLALAASPAARQQQKTNKWVRVYTYDDAVVEMEEVAFTFGEFGRVRFRTVFDKTQPMRGKVDVKYKTIVEDTELDCLERVYRVTETVFLDKKGDVIQAYKPEIPGPWKRTNSFMAGRLYGPACRMIAKKKLE
ncbi:MAG TPA: hypothetical protein VGP08_04365 [Pyrinomonadaceae bacterium]|jgi:hypothetical protein|nr:hypothetical protein [Pyrinomonadaceae bacterium]